MELLAIEQRNVWGSPLHGTQLATPSWSANFY